MQAASRQVSLGANDRTRTEVVLMTLGFLIGTFLMGTGVILITASTIVTWFVYNPDFSYESVEKWNHWVMISGACMVTGLILVQGLMFLPSKD